MDQILARVIAYRQQLIDQLPDYAFQYEEGDRYVSQSHMIRIEEQVMRFKAQIMEDHICRTMATPNVATTSTASAGLPAAANTTPKATPNVAAAAVEGTAPVKKEETS